MAKPFKNVRIEAQDDGKFQVEITPYIEPKKGKKDHCSPSTWEEEESKTKRVTANTLEDIPKVIKKATGGSDLKSFMNPSDE